MPFALIMLYPESKRISSLDDSESDTAKICNIHYDHTRDALLAAFTWNFAMSGSELSKDSAADPIGEFSNLFQLPTDCLRVVELY